MGGGTKRVYIPLPLFKFFCGKYHQKGMNKHKKKYISFILFRDKATLREHVKKLALLFFMRYLFTCIIIEKRKSKVSLENQQRYMRLFIAQGDEEDKAL